MKKTIIVALILITAISIFLFNNIKATPPEDLVQFIENTDDGNYWAFDATPNSLYILMHHGKYYKSFSVGLLSEKIPQDYKDFEEQIYSVDFNDSRIENSVMSWMRIGNNPLSGPERYDSIPYTVYNTKAYFNETSNKLAVSLDKIYDYNKMGEPFLNDWINLTARYNLKGAQGGLPIPIEAYQGSLMILLNESFTKMNEIYQSNDEWLYIRHVEKGQYPRNINENDLDSILENFWWGWENIIQPFVEQLN